MYIAIDHIAAIIYSHSHKYKQWRWTVNKILCLLLNCVNILLKCIQSITKIFKMLFCVLLMKYIVQKLFKCEIYVLGMYVS